MITEWKFKLPEPISMKPVMTDAADWLIRIWQLKGTRFSDFQKVAT